MVRTRLEREVGRDVRWFQYANSIFLLEQEVAWTWVSQLEQAVLSRAAGKLPAVAIQKAEPVSPLPPPYKPGSPCSWRSGWGGGFPSSRWELSFQVTWRGHWLALSPCLARPRDEGVSCCKHGVGLVGQLQRKAPRPWVDGPSASLSFRF